jgi:hypothetical protein
MPRGYSSQFSPNPYVSWDEWYCENPNCDVEDFGEDDIERLPDGTYKCKHCGHIGKYDEFCHTEGDVAY